MEVCAGAVGADGAVGSDGAARAVGAAGTGGAAEAAILDTVVELRGPSFEATKWRRNRRTPREDWTVCLLWVSAFFCATLWSQNLARFHMEILKYDMVYTYAYVYAFVYVYV